VICEDFEDGTADGWTGVLGNPMSVVPDGANRVYRSTTEISMYVAGNTTWINQAIEADVKPSTFTTTAASDGVTLYARLNGFNGYVARLRGDGSVVLQTTQGGTATDLGAPVAAGIRPGTWYHVRLEAIGSTISLYLDGVLSRRATNATFPQGQVGLGVRNSTADFDNVRVSLP